MIDDAKAGLAESIQARLLSRGGDARGTLWIGPERSAPVDDGEALLLRLDNEALKHAVAGEGDQVTRIEGSRARRRRRRSAPANG